MPCPELVVFGCLTIDNVVRADGEVLPPSYGGNGVYCSLGARVWSDRVGLVARRGKGYPLKRLAMLASLGIDVAGVSDVDEPHGLNIAFAYRDDGSRTRSFTPAMLAAIPDHQRHHFWDVSNHPQGHEILAAYAPRVEDVPGYWWPGLRIGHCTSLPSEKTRGIAMALRARAGQRVRIHVDSLWDDNVGSRATDALPILEVVDAILPSEQDLLNAVPTVSPRDTALALAAAGGRTVVLKRGGDGCRIHEPGQAEAVDVPVFPVAAVDPTGAGDAFCGGFMAGFRETGSARMAALYGAVAASFCVAGNGIDGLTGATREEALHRLRWLQDRTGLDS
jgi:ribokinase